MNKLLLILLLSWTALQLQAQNNSTENWIDPQNLVSEDYQSPLQVYGHTGLSSTSTTTCAQLHVDVDLMPVKYCQSSYLTVNYKNESNHLVDSAYIHLKIDPLFIVDSVNAIYHYNSQQDIYEIPLGLLAAQEHGSLQFFFHVVCDSNLHGQAHEVEAHIYPDTLCDFQESYLLVDASVDVMNQLRFTIHNPGKAQSQAVRYRIIEDFLLVGGMNQQLTVNTIKLKEKETFEYIYPNYNLQRSYKLELRNLHTNALISTVVITYRGGEFIILHQYSKLPWNQSNLPYFDRSIQWNNLQESSPHGGGRLSGYVDDQTQETTEAETPAEIKSNVYPNPIEDKAVIQILNSYENEHFEFRLYNSSGQLLRIEQTNSSIVKFERKDLTAGLYYYEFIGQFNKFSRGKIILK